MHVTALGAQGLPDQRRWHGHGRLPEMDPAQRERLWVGLMVQPIAPHHTGLGGWHMQQPALQKVRDGQGHPLKPRARAGSLLLPGARGEGDAVPVPRHKPGILEGAAAQLAGEIRDHPRAVRIALHDPHVPLRLRRVAQAVQEVEHLLRSHRFRQGQRATRQGLPERRHHLPQGTNQALHQRRLRIEHVNSSVKRCRIVKDRIRLWKQGVRDLVMELCCALHNFRVRLTPWQPMI
jgi:hypothetical protein